MISRHNRPNRAHAEESECQGRNVEPDPFLAPAAADLDFVFGGVSVGGLVAGGAIVLGVETALLQQLDLADTEADIVANQGSGLMTSSAYKDLQSAINQYNKICF